MFGRGIKLICEGNVFVYYPNLCSVHGLEGRIIKNNEFSLVFLSLNLDPVDMITKDNLF